MAWIPWLRLGFRWLRLQKYEARALGRVEAEPGLGLGPSRGFPYNFIYNITNIYIIFKFLSSLDYRVTNMLTTKTYGTNIYYL